MALAKRIIPCLDVDNGRVVKGVKFENIRDAGDPVEIARRYDEQGADEITFLDITASVDGRDTTLHTVERMASQVFIPLTVGGGVRTVQDIRNLLNAGADKVSINTAAVFNPEFVGEAAQHFGSQCIVVAIDAKKVSGPGETPRWEIFTHGGRKPTGLDAVEWAKKMEGLGAGEILLTSMDQDGMKKNGFDLGVTRAISDALGIPVIASGGVGNLQHLADGILEGHASAVLAASIFPLRRIHRAGSQGLHGSSRHRDALNSTGQWTAWRAQGTLGHAMDSGSPTCLNVFFLSSPALLCCSSAEPTPKKIPAPVWCC